ncbi:MAG: IS21 family transposase [bacterium]
MVTDAQVRLLRQKRMDGKTQEAAAAAAGMSVRTAREWERGPLPSEARQPRLWRTRSDPFESVWASEIVPLLQTDEAGVLQATTIFDWLEDRHPGQFPAGQLRTLQRRLRDWRALHGGEREVFFPQQHPPGREAQLDFTHARELGVTIAGEPLDHLLFVLVLSFSGWTWAKVVFGETFEALVAGLQAAFWRLGGVTAVARTDNLSAATHDLKHEGGRVLNERFASVLDHYGIESTRIRPGESNENGVVEQTNRRLKDALRQALVIRGSRDFVDLAAYEAFVEAVVERRNRRFDSRLAEERPHLRPLPPSPVPAYSTYRVQVHRWSTVRVGGRTYSVPSRLIGHEVEARLHPDWVEILYGGQPVERMPRLRGAEEYRIDYRHVIWSLVRKPGAFARYRYREGLFPSEVFRRTYDALVACRGERADVEYVRVLHLAASTMESSVERALTELLAEGKPFSYTDVRERVAPPKPSVPEIAIPEPDLHVYDAFLVGGER